MGTVMVGDALRLSVGWALPWLLGIFLVIASQRGRVSLRQAGDVAWVVGSGWFVGAFALTLWMRALSIVNVPFSLVSIGSAVAILSVALAALALKRTSRHEWSRTAQLSWNELRGAALSGW